MKNMNNQTKKVMKFGGSSLKDANSFLKVIDIIKKENNTVVVTSAINNITNLLLLAINEAKNKKYTTYFKILKNHEKIIKQLKLKENILEKEFQELKEDLKKISFIKINKKTKDKILFYGEIFSAKLLAKKLNAKYVFSGEIGVLTDSSFGNACLLKESYNLIKQNLKKENKTIVVTGYGGKDKNQNCTTFSRNGSDYVATIIGVAIDAKEIQIWKDVDGFLTADPNIISNPKKIKIMTFDEASQLAYFGAKILHPKTIWPAIKKQIPVVIKNTFNPLEEGTKIISKTDKKGITAISFKKNITIINIRSVRMLDVYGYLSRIFEVFNNYAKPVDVITTSEIDVSLSVDDDEHLEEIIKDLKKIAHVNVYKNKTILLVVGEGLKNNTRKTSEIINQIAKANIPIEMISQCHKQINLTLIISERYLEKALLDLHFRFFE